MKLTKKHVLSAISTFSTVHFLLSGILIEIINASINDELSIYDSSNCTKEELQLNGYCELSCISERKHLYEWHWIYYITSPSENATIYDGVDMIDLTMNGSDYTQISLHLTNYSAGYYRCWFHYLNSTYPNHYFAINDFKIDLTEKGDLVSCNTSDQCLSLEATCANNTCQCQYPYLYSLDTSEYTIACLKGVGPFRPCNVDQQCVTAGDNFKCISDICDCSANSTYMYVGEVNEYLCLLPVFVGQSCVYDEECTLAYSNTWCYENICDCRDNYYYNNTVDVCINGTISTPVVYPDDALTFGEVVGIVVGIAAVITIIFAAIGFCITMRARR